MKKNELEINRVKKLNKTKLLNINGGDKFTYDLGYVLGTFFKALCDLPPGTQIRGH